MNRISERLRRWLHQPAPDRSGPSVADIAGDDTPQHPHQSPYRPLHEQEVRAAQMEIEGRAS